MKTISTIFLLALFIGFSSCKKNKEISYPTSGIYGENILTKNNGDSLSYLRSYSLAADLNKKAELKVVFNNQSLGNEVWFYSSGDGWIVGDYQSSGSQTFTSTRDGAIDLKLEFAIGPGTYLGGKCQVDIYENSDDITKSINLKW